MISTASGFITGLITGVMVSALYGEQLAERFQAIIPEPTALPAPARPPAPRVPTPFANPVPTATLAVPTPLAGSDAAEDVAAVAATPYTDAPAPGASVLQVPKPGETSVTVIPVAPDTAFVSEPAISHNPDETLIAEPTISDKPNETLTVKSATAAEPQPSLEQRWRDYAVRAEELEPVGSFPWQRCFRRAAASHDLPQALLLAIASGESNFDPAARSDKDAVGLMQIQWPATGIHLGIHREADLYDPCTNVDAGTRYLRELLQRYGENLHLAVAAYNYGPTRVTANQVPEGARWYSHYIYQHLQRVLGRESTATSALMPRPTASGAGREVLMTFNRAHRARDFADFLTREAPDLNLQVQTEIMGRHEVVLLYASADERRRALQSLVDAGVGFVSPQSKPKTYL